MDELWKLVLEEIQIEVSKPIFLTFFKGTSLVLFENNVATISAPTYITAEYIEKRYYSLIKKILDKKTGASISLVFTSQKRVQPAPKDLPGGLFTRKESSQRLKPARIRQDYTFENLAVSESNQIAYTAAKTVASNLGVKYNPLFLYGNVGVGKTHLMHSVANKVLSVKEDAEVIYLTTEEFTNEVVEAIRDKSTAALRRKFRNTDLLLLDDIQFLSGKEKVQEELFHTFNSLIDKGKQVVFSSDRPPYEIKKIEARLASRFEGGLTVDIESPDFELRTAILLIKSRKYGIELTTDLAKIVAERIGDTRALEGFLLRLSSVLSSRGTNQITEQIILTTLGNPREEARTTIHPDNIISSICSYYNIKQTQLKGVKRDSFLVKPRHVCMYLLKEEAGLTFVEIGNLLGGRDHTTVMHAVEKIKGLTLKSEKLNEEILFIKRLLKDN